MTRESSVTSFQHMLQSLKFQSLLRQCGQSFPTNPEKAAGNPSRIPGAGVTNTGGVCSAKHARIWSPRNCQHSTRYDEPEVHSHRPSSMGTKPGERMMGQLERYGQSRGRGGWVSWSVGRRLRMMGQLERRAEVISGEFCRVSLQATVTYPSSTARELQ